MRRVLFLVLACVSVALPASAEFITVKFAVEITNLRGSLPEPDPVIAALFPVGAQGWIDMTYDTDDARLVWAPTGWFINGVQSVSYWIDGGYEGTTHVSGGRILYVQEHSFSGIINGAGPHAEISPFRTEELHFTTNFAGLVQTGTLPTALPDESFSGGSFWMFLDADSVNQRQFVEGRVTSVRSIPEPSSLLLALLGVGGFCARRLRRPRAA